MSPEKLLDILTDRCREILGGDLVGIYVHGSYAMGCFNPAKSDIDFIIVCESEPADNVKRQIMDMVIALERMGPAKGLEMHLMTRGDCREYADPPNFVLHYSGAHTQAYLSDPKEYTTRMRGQDMDLWAHITVLRARGTAWHGPDISEVFLPVPEGAYMRSVLAELGWEAGDGMYHVLNHCRTLSYLDDGRIRSKAEGAQWALENMEPRFRGVIREALECYKGGRAMKIDGAAYFCECAIAKIRRFMKV